MRRSGGLKPGQTIAIDAPTRDVDDDFVITQVNTVNDAGNLLAHHVTAVQGTIVPDLPGDTYKKWNAA